MQAARSLPNANANAVVSHPAVPPTATEDAGASVAVSWPEMVSHRDALVRFAQRKLHDPMLAEDVVHDVFEAVLCGRARFGGRSALRSWLTAILKHKIVDLVRQRVRLDSLNEADDEDGDGDARESTALRCPLPLPDEVAEQRQRLHRALRRIDALPANLREVMQLRVLQDRPAREVCATLRISEDNLFVRLHRARKQLVS